MIYVHCYLLPNSIFTPYLQFFHFDNCSLLYPILLRTTFSPLALLNSLVPSEVCHDREPVSRLSARVRRSRSNELRFPFVFSLTIIHGNPWSQSFVFKLPLFRIYKRITVASMSDILPH